MLNCIHIRFGAPMLIGCLQNVWHSVGVFSTHYQGAWAVPGPSDDLILVCQPPKMSKETQKFQIIFIMFKISKISKILIVLGFLIFSELLKII